MDTKFSTFTITPGDNNKPVALHTETLGGFSDIHGDEGSDYIYVSGKGVLLLYPGDDVSKPTVLSTYDPEEYMILLLDRLDEITDEHRKQIPESWTLLIDPEQYFALSGKEYDVELYLIPKDPGIHKTKLTPLTDDMRNFTKVNSKAETVFTVNNSIRNFKGTNPPKLFIWESTNPTPPSGYDHLDPGYIFYEGKFIGIIVKEPTGG